jgi:hypothetical protein
MEVGGEFVASDEEPSDLVAGGFDAEDLVGLRVEEEAGGDDLVCEWGERSVRALEAGVTKEVKGDEP